MSGCQLSHSFDTVATMPPPCSPHSPPCSPQCSTLGGARKLPRQLHHQGEDGREAQDGIWEQQQEGSSWEQEGSTLGNRSLCRTLSHATMRSATLRRRREEGGQCRGTLGKQCATHSGQCSTLGGQCCQQCGTLGGQCGQCGTLTFRRPPAWSAAAPHHDLGPSHHSEAAWR